MKTKILILSFLSIATVGCSALKDTPNISQINTNRSETIENSVSNQEEKKYSEEELRKMLTPLQYEVTQNGATEDPYTNEYDKNYEEGIYVDIIDGTPLFSSTTKFDSGTGWPSFSSPINNSFITLKEDNILFYSRTEVKSSSSDSHLGHVFDDGPEETGGLRYCLNSASLKFIAKSDLESQGYGEYLSLFE